jgi:hypothetical protein
MMNQLVAFTDRIPALIAAGERASCRFFEFFTAQIRNPNTRRAYARAAVEFFDWLAARGVTRLTAGETVHVGEPCLDTHDDRRAEEVTLDEVERVLI